MTGDHDTDQASLAVYHEAGESFLGAVRAKAAAPLLATKDFPLANMIAGIRTLRFADGPDEVHKNALARAELRRQADRRSPATAAR